MAQVLLVDDEASVRRVLAAILGEDGHTVVEAAGVTEARRLLATTPFDLVITDQKMPDGEGLSLVASARETDPALPVVIVTAFATVELAVAALKEGAFDFITKPFVAETVRAAVRRASERTALVRENESLRGAVRHLGGERELVGESAAIRRVRDLISRVGPTNATALITGETGVGKELVARALHEASPRALHSFVAVNCAAFTETLLESELFGHERGAFTGADRSRQGLFEAAHRGTLFLDEVGEMAPAMQARLLRVLVDGEVVRVGTNVPRKVDVRLLVATHRNLPERVRDGLFREDLYYRIA
ncbi:MAG TPA: sigma-54 dependent transcriptional regulator, partial [Thermoanaerobaculia bacterium]